MPRSAASYCNSDCHCALNLHLAAPRLLQHPCYWVAIINQSRFLHPSQVRKFPWTITVAEHPRHGFASRQLVEVARTAEWSSSHDRLSIEVKVEGKVKKPLPGVLTLIQADSASWPDISHHVPHLTVTLNPQTAPSIYLLLLPDQFALTLQHISAM